MKLQSRYYLNANTISTNTAASNMDKIQDTSINANTISTNTAACNNEQILPSSDDTVSSSFADLVEARNEECSWEPRIIMDIEVPQCVKEFLPLDVFHDNGIDIVKLTTEPSLTLATILEHDYGYPKHCTLRFEGYKGIEQMEDLKRDVINAASQNGTILVVDVKDNFQYRGNR